MADVQTENLIVRVLEDGTIVLIGLKSTNQGEVSGAREAGLTAIRVGADKKELREIARILMEMAEDSSTTNVMEGAMCPYCGSSRY